MSVGIIKVHPNSPDEYSLDLESGQTLEIGRRPSVCGQKKLIILQPEVSGSHAEIRSTPSGWTIRDSGSTNGTKLNGERLMPGKEYVLRDGDQIMIAQVNLLIELNEKSSSQCLTAVEQDLQEHTQIGITLITATILVGDIRAFTSLMERYADRPELVMKVAQQIFGRIRQEIIVNHGQMEKIAGDAVMAYWTSNPSAQKGAQGPAIQACHAALSLRTLVAEMACDKNFWPFADHKLYLDMALATGPVAAGCLGVNEANPALLGDTANVAFRLEKMIPSELPGSVVCDGMTCSLVTGIFDCQHLGQFELKGRTGKVDLYCILREKMVDMS